MIKFIDAILNVTNYYSDIFKALAYIDCCIYTNDQGHYVIVNPGEYEYTKEYRELIWFWWGVLVYMYGEYGTSPRSGWIVDTTKFDEFFPLLLYYFDDESDTPFEDEEKLFEYLRKEYEKNE